MKSTKKSRKDHDNTFGELASEEKITSEEYKIWKRHVPFMYGSVSVRTTEFAAPSIEWLAPVENDLNDLLKQRVLYGSHGTESHPENHIYVSSVFMQPVKEFEQGELYETKVNEYGQFQFYLDKFAPTTKIPHKGIVFSVRHMPSNEDLIASRNEHDLFIYDLSLATDPVVEEDDDDDTQIQVTQDSSLKSCEPMFEASGVNINSDLKWHKHDEGILLSGFENSKIALWEIEQQNGRRKKKALPTRQLAAKTIYEGHTGTVNDVAWHSLHPTIFGSVSDEGEIAVWDTRSRNTSRPSHMIKGHMFGANSLDFNPFSEYLFATSSLDRSVALWDLRNLKVKLHSIQVRKDTFFGVKWSPHFRNLLATSNHDKRIHIFDINRIFNEQSNEDAEDGDACLLFSHGGHTSKVFDFQWNPHKELTILSTSDDNVVQIWDMNTKYMESTFKSSPATASNPASNLAAK